MQRVVWGTVFAVAVGATVLAWGVGTWWDMQTTLSRAHEQLQATARLLEQHADRAFEAGDKVVQGVAELANTADFTNPKDEERLHEQIKRLIAGSPQIASAWVLDAEGRAVSENWAFPARRGPFMDREYFRAHSEGELGLFIGPQAVGPSVGVPRFTLSRSVIGPDRQFKGVAAAGIVTSYFADIYREADLGPGSRLLLTTTAGAPLAAWPFALLNEAVATTEPVMRVERALQRYPVHVVVVVREEAVLAPWRQRMAATGVAALGVILASAWLTRMGLRTAGREDLFRRGLEAANRTLETRVEERAAALRQSEEMLNRVLEHLPVGVGVYDPAGRFILRNPALAHLGLAALPSTHQVGNAQWIGHGLDGQRLDRSQFPGARALRGEIVVPGLEFLHRSEDSTVAWRRISAVPLERHPGDDGTAAGVIVIEDIDQLKRSEEELASRLEELRAVYDTAPIGLCVFDRDLRFLRINHRMAEINGLPAEEHIGRAVSDILPGLLEPAQALLRQVVETRQPILNFEVAGETPAQPGVQRSWLESWVPLFGDDGEVAGVSVVAEETTERKRAERELHDAHLRLTSLLAAARAGTFSCELPRGAIHADAGAAALFGMPADIMRNARVEQVNTRIHPDDLPQVRARVRNVLRGATSYEDEYRVVLEDGSIRWLAARGSVDVERVLHGAVFDITALKEAQEEAQESERQLRLVADSVPAMIAFLGQDERFRFVNRGYCEWLERAPEELLGRTLREVAEPSTYAAMTPRIEAALRGEHVRYEGPAPRSKRRDRTVHSYYIPYVDTEGMQDGFFLFILNVTEQKRREVELQRTTEQLRLVADTAPALIAFVGPDLRYRFVNQPYCEWLGLDRTIIEGRTVLEVVGDKVRTVLGPYVEAALRGEAVSFETTASAAKGGERDFQSRFIPYTDPTGAADGFFSFSLDVTEQKRREAELRDTTDRLRLLIGELNHRVKNTLATVHSIARQTLRRPDVAADAREAIEARLLALGRSHELLSKETWGSVAFGELAHEALVAFGVDNVRTTRFRLNGPDVRVPPHAALALGMALHELATNAVKYGALSFEAGAVELTWHLTAGSRLAILWKEKGGPPVKPPKRQGFGSRLLERGLAYALGGSVELDYAPDGLRCQIEFTLAASEAADA